MENKTATIHIRCTPSDKKEIQNLAKEAKISMSEYLIRQNKKHIVHHIPLLKLMASLSYNDMKVENNINHIAKNFNSHISFVTDEKINELIYWLIELGKKRDKIIIEEREIRKILAR